MKRTYRKAKKFLAVAGVEPATRVLFLTAARALPLNHTAKIEAWVLNSASPSLRAGPPMPKILALLDSNQRPVRNELTALPTELRAKIALTRIASDTTSAGELTRRTATPSRSLQITGTHKARKEENGRGHTSGDEYPSPLLKCENSFTILRKVKREAELLKLRPARYLSFRSASVRVGMVATVRKLEAHSKGD